LYKNSSKLTTNDDKSAEIIQQTTLGDGSDNVNGIENKLKSNDEKIENPSDEMLDIAINKEQQPESMDAKEIKEPIESTESLNPTAIKKTK
ncbi:13283_t:CDS:1, partial [Entrophospora sp. SA101]